MINGENHAVPIGPAGEDGEAVVKYMHENSRAAGVKTRYTSSKHRIGDFGLVTAAAE